MNVFGVLEVESCPKAIVMSSTTIYEVTRSKKEIKDHSLKIHLQAGPFALLSGYLRGRFVGRFVFILFMKLSFSLKKNYMADIRASGRIFQF